MSRTLFALALLAAPLSARAASPTELIAALSSKEQAPAALDQLVALKQDALPALGAAAEDGRDLTQRGWAIVGLRRVGGAQADQVLARIVEGAQQPALVRTWAAAARIDLAPDLDALLALAPLAQAYPATQRPMMKRVGELVNTGQPISAERLMLAAAQDYQLQAALAPTVVALPSDALLQPMLHSTNQRVRMMAASFLATQGQRPGGAEGVAAVVVRGLAFEPAAQDVPWAGGPLYIPGIAWKKAPATQLVGQLIRWYLWADRHGNAAAKTQVANNLNSLGLGNVVGYQPSWGDSDSAAWLRIWAQVAGGRAAVRALLAEQGAAADPQYQPLLEKLP